MRQEQNVILFKGESFELKVNLDKETVWLTQQ